MKKKIKKIKISILRFFNPKKFNRVPYSYALQNKDGRFFYPEQFMRC